MSQPIVDVSNLTVVFSGGRVPVKAVNGVDLKIAAGDAVALLGESGSGKSVTLRALMRLLPEKTARIEADRMTVAGQTVLDLPKQDLTRYRGGIVSMIFQEPALALDPVYTLGDQIAETVVRHEGVSFSEGRKRALDLFERVRIPSPQRRLEAYPHEMSGGMRQRAMIALALACQPKVLLADEPTTALDATVQIQILLLLRELQRELGLAIIFVTHDIGAAVEIADRIAVMYAGRIVEEGPVRTLIREPRHPYTIGLLKSRAHGAMAKGGRLETIPGSPPDLAALPPGCAFAPRCTFVADSCATIQPPVVQISPDHAVRCLQTDATQNAAPKLIEQD